MNFTFNVKCTILFIRSDSVKTKIKELRKINKVSQDELALDVYKRQIPLYASFILKLLPTTSKLTVESVLFNSVRFSLFPRLR